MAADTTQQDMTVAILHHQAGRFSQAEALYDKVLAINPDHADALHLAGVVAYQTGRGELAIDRIRRAIEANPKAAQFHNNFGLALVAQGQAESAVVAYMTAIRLQPDLAAAHHNLGNALKMRGHIDAAIDAYRSAIRFNKNDAEAHNNLANLLNLKGDLDGAVEAYRTAIRLKANYAEAISNLGNTLTEQSKLDEAISALVTAIRLKPNIPESFFNLARAYRASGRLEESIKAYQEALRLKPNSPEILNSLGNAVGDMGRLNSAAEILRAAIGLKPDYAAAHNNLGVVLSQLGRNVEAIEACRTSLRLQPGKAEVYGNLGNALLAHNQLDAAEEAFRSAIAYKNDSAMPYNNLAGVLKEQGRLDEAIDAYRTAMKIQPTDTQSHSNLIYSLHFDPRCTAQELIQEQKTWSDVRGAAMRKLKQPHDNDRSPGQKLRIGYVSGDFRDHVVGRNLMPLMSGHDRKNFEIYCYSNTLNPDAYTDRLRGFASQWRSIVGAADADVVKAIRADKIDILVDLSLHMAGNRLSVFAARPAPIQATFMGYPGGTGLEEMDYRITDPYLDPPSENQLPYRERPARLRDCFWCYQGFVDETSDPEVGELPASRVGHITFGCTNNFCKVNEGVLALWARVLAAVPTSRLLIVTQAGGHRDKTLEKLAALGVAAQRIEFVDKQPRPEYLRLHQRIDIMLDTFPYNGHTTGCDALWMGTPIVTLIGPAPVCRAGLSLLSNVGLTELVAQSTDDYVKIASELAGGLPRLGILRATLRSRMKASPLMDGVRFARNVEHAYRDFYNNWHKICDA